VHVVGWQHDELWQLPLEQSVPTLQEVPVPHVGQVPPPQSVPVSAPFLIESMHVAAAQVPLGQLSVVQSDPTLHFWFTAHFGQLPPQSTSVSSPFCV
jgi:hypothetical protein